MRYNGVYMVTSTVSQAHTTADVLIELQVPAATQIEIIRAWVSPDTGLTDDIQEIEFYLNDAVSTGGTSGNERKIQGIGDANASTVALITNPTQGATPFTLLSDGFHLQQGWLYLPMEDERIRVAGGTATDNFGMKLAAAPAASITISYGIVWGEIG